MNHCLCHKNICRLDDLDSLEEVNINDLDTEVEDDDIYSLSEKEECDMIETWIQLMTDYVDENPREISESDFEEEMIEHIWSVVCNTNDIFFRNVISTTEWEVVLEETLDVALDLFYSLLYPVRSYPSTFVSERKKTDREKQEIQRKIDYLSSKPQPVQRTEAWYTFRNNLITASNAYKAFENQSTQNQLIYEKCKSVSATETNSSTNNAFVNIDSSLHWGQKYEPISVLLYEEEYNVIVGEFGCIQHDKYSFLGASPDGIIIDTDSKRFGRMLEIKNIVNREIDGIPKKEYWIQMQLQMETCDLNECDFLETKFVEYENEKAFLEDAVTEEPFSFLETREGDKKGIILYFSSSDGRPFYIYKPLTMDHQEFEGWFQEQLEKYADTHCWIKNIYWKLEEYSCVLVLRNKQWFRDNIIELANIWNIILKERETGYEHREPARRSKKETFPSPFVKTGDENPCFFHPDNVSKRKMSE
jgi:putative phage-type endonuclease